MAQWLKHPHLLSQWYILGQDRIWACIVSQVWGIKLTCQVAKSQTRLSDFSFTFHFHALEKEMATHSSVLAWRIPGTAEPGGLPSMGSHRVGHDWSVQLCVTEAAAVSQLIKIVPLSGCHCFPQRPVDSCYEFSPAFPFKLTLMCGRPSRDRGYRFKCIVLEYMKKSFI